MKNVTTLCNEIITLYDILTFATNMMYATLVTSHHRGFLNLTNYNTEHLNGILYQSQCYKRFCVNHNVFCRANITETEVYTKSTLQLGEVRVDEHQIQGIVMQILVVWFASASTRQSHVDDRHRSLLSARYIHFTAFTVY